MFDSDEADGYNQLGQNLTPASESQAASTVDGFKQLGDKAFHAVLGQTNFPEWKDLFDVMFTSNAETTQVASQAAQQGLPNLELVQSDASFSGGQAFPGIEAVNPQLEPPLHALDSPFQTEALGNVVNEIFKTLLPGPLGIFAAVLQFLIGMFAEFLSAAGQFLSEAAQSAATFAAEAWKKELELGSGLNSSG